MKNLTLCFLIIISSFLVGCNDTDENAISAANVASINAGADLSTLEGQTITLSATAYPEGGTVTWTQVSGTFIDGFPILDTLTANIIAPDVSVDTTLVFLVEYISPDGQLVTDEINVMVENVSSPPVAIIKMEEGVVAPFRTYDVVTLLGDSSYDSDGEVRGYLWQQIDQQAPLEFIGDLDESTVQFKAPFVSQITNYQIQLTVTDNYGLASVNTIDIQIDSAKEKVAANAGEAQTVEEFTRVYIDGSDSASSLPELNCLWTQINGTEATLDDNSLCETTFIAPDVDAIESLIFELTVTDSDNNMATDQVIITVKPRNLGLLHDTGVTECYDESAVIDCGDDSFPMQDADTGRDEINEFIDKSGAGPRSFDFTKLDVNGDELPNDSLVFSCVRDNFSGLIWEVKQPSTLPRFGTLRSVDNYYSMNSDQAALTSCPSEDECSVEMFVDTVNEQTFCGGANWRLPSYMELLQLMDYYDIDKSSLLASEYFSHTPDTAELGHKFYWVSDTSAEGGASSFNWVLDLETGDDSAITFSQVAYVILVRTP